MSFSLQSAVGLRPGRRNSSIIVRSSSLYDILSSPHLT